MIPLQHLKGKKIGVLGLGKTGLATAKALKKSDIEYFAWDDREETRRDAEKEKINIQKFDDDNIKKLDRIILSPGIPHEYPQPHWVIELAKNNNIPFCSDISLLREAYPENPFYCVTGTNGKSTTTALLAHILEKDFDVRVGGNLGQASLSMQPPKNDKTIFVLELSSYQIDITKNLDPEIGILLNLSPDHIDRHGDMAGYAGAKQSMFQVGLDKNQRAIIGVDDDFSKKIFDDLKNTSFDTVAVSMIDVMENGIFVEDNTLISVKDNEKTDLFSLSEISRLKGKHNWQNIACAYSAAEYAGMNVDDIFDRIKSFPGLPHRQFLTRVINGISYINDSKATNADATSQALKAFNKIYWIIGGEAKDGGLNGLEPHMDKIVHAFLIGTAEDEFAQWLDDKGVDYTRCKTLDNAVNLSHVMAQSKKGEPGAGNTVLLSPACASWDQFKSFEHRGDCFTECVNALNE